MHTRVALLRPALVRGEHDASERVGTVLASWEGPRGELRIAANVEDAAAQQQVRDGTLRGIDSLPYYGKDTSEFDALVQSCALGAVHRCASQWGEHLVRVEARGSELAAPAAVGGGAAPSKGFGGGAARKKKR